MVSNNEIARLVDDYIRGPDKQAIMKECLIGKMAMAEIAEKHCLSESRVKQIVTQGKARLFSAMMKE